MRGVYITVLTLIIQLSAFGQGSSNITLLYNWNDTSLASTIAHNNRYNEIWGVAINGREYAVIGSTMGTHIFDVTDPSNVDTTAFIPGAATGAGIVHRDYHDYNGYLYIVCDEDEGPTLSTLQIVDLNFLPASAPVVYDAYDLFKNSHNIFIDSATARLYVSGLRRLSNPPLANSQELEVYSLANPLAPVLLDSSDWGRHDVYVRNDTAYLNDGGSGLWVVDFQTPGSAQLLGSFISVDSGYNHSGWLSEDGNIYAMAEETFGISITLLDVSDLANISILSRITSGVDVLSIPHNLIIKDGFLYASYYQDGVYIFDISDPVNPSIAGYYDTSSELHLWGSYRGAWGVYPLLPSGRMLVSDMQNGLYVFDVTQAVGIHGENEVVSQETEIHPNPFSDFVVISNLPDAGREIRTEIYNQLGQLVSSSSSRSLGGEITIDTELLPNGIYDVIVSGVEWKESHKLIKIK